MSVDDLMGLSIIDVLVIGAGGILGFGLNIYLERRMRGRGFDVWVDGIAILGGAGLFAFVLFLYDAIVGGISG